MGLWSFTNIFLLISSCSFPTKRLAMCGECKKQMQSISFVIRGLQFWNYQHLVCHDIVHREENEYG